MGNTKQRKRVSNHPGEKTAKPKKTKRTKVVNVSSCDNSDHSDAIKRPNRRSAGDSSSNPDSEDEEVPGKSRSNFSMLEDILPAEARMLRGQKAQLNKMSMGEVLDLVKLKREAEQASLGETSSKYSKDRAPKEKTYREQSDDGFKTLHKARFLRAPLSSTGKWWKHVPTTRSHIYKNLPLKFSGSQGKISEKTIGTMHDRAKSLTIKNFHSQNACVTAKPMRKIERKDSEGLVTLYDYSWEEPSSLAEFTEALVNYMVALQQLWPLDPTALIMLRLINQYKWISVANELREKIAVLSGFFNAVLEENRGRAVRNETILDFKEQEDVLKSALTAHNLPCSIPTSRFAKPEQDMFAKNKFKPSQTGQFAFTPGRRDRPQPSRPRAQSNGLGVCYAFNNGSCRGVPSASGCKNVNTNRELAHVCNVYVDSKSAFCLEKHPRNKHR